MDTSNKSIDVLLNKLSEDIGRRESKCVKHGAYTSTGARIKIGKGREIWTSCPGCKVDADKQQEQEVAAASAAAKSAELEAMLRQTAIPARFIGRSFDNYQVGCDGQAKALGMCREYAREFDRHVTRGTSLIFSGNIGTGKSHLAAAVLQAILPAHIGAYVTVGDLFRMVRDTWRRDSEVSERQIMRLLCDEVDLLVIDEVGAQYGTDGEQNLLFEVMDRRYSGMRPTILLTNQDKEGLKTFVGDRVYDRLRETSRWVAFDWPSYRPTARAQA